MKKILYELIIRLNTVIVMRVGFIIVGLIYLDFYYDLINIIINYSPFILSFLITVSLVTFYLDDFKFSKTLIIKYLQIFCFISILFSPLLYYYFIDDVFNIIFCFEDNNKDSVNLHGHVNMDKEAAKHIGKSINTIGSQVGLAGTIAGVSTAVAKGIAKSSIPPLQKTGLVLGGAVIGGIVHTLFSSINRNNALHEYNSNNSSNISNNITNIDPSINKFIGDITSNFSPLQEILLGIQAINSICLYLFIILIIQLLTKFFVGNNVSINISNIIGTNLNNKFNYYLNKLILLNKKVNNIYIWLNLFVILIGLTSSGYFAYELFTNLDNYIDVHNYLKGNK